MKNTQKPLKGNLHTHTWRCKHASGDTADYAEEAVKKGLDFLGFSEHMPFPDDRWNDVRMDFKQLEDYGKAVDTVKKERSDIIILKGMECDWVKDYKNYLVEEYRDRRKYDYLIGSIHWFPVDGEWIFSYSKEAEGKLKHYAEHMIEMIKTEMFDFIAHPDLFSRFTDKWDDEADFYTKEICAAAESCKIPLEINGYGFRKAKIKTSDGERYAYPHPRFWEIASDYKIKVLCNSDAHRPEDVAASIDKASEIADMYSLEYADMSFLYSKGKSIKYA